MPVLTRARVRANGGIDAVNAALAFQQAFPGLTRTIGTQTRRAVNAAGYVIGRAGRNWLRSARGTARYLSRGWTKQLGGKSASANGTSVLSRRGRTKFMKRGRGGFRSRRVGRRRRFRGRRRGGMFKRIVDMFTTPQITKTTYAENFASEGYGLRTWTALPLNTANTIGDCWKRRPYRFWNADAATVANINVAGNQLAMGNMGKLCVKSVNHVHTLQNRSNWDMELKVYECLVRRDIDISASVMTRIVTLFTGSSDAFPLNRDYLQPVYPGGTDLLASVYQNPAYTPYMSTAFCKLFKILKTTKFNISANDYVKYSVGCRFKKFDSADIVNADDVGGIADLIGGWTKVLLVTWIGGPVDNSTTGGSSFQSKAIADLFIQTDRTVKFYFEPNSILKYQITSSNVTTDQLDADVTNRYTTNTANTAGMVVPATTVVQTSVEPDAEVAPDNP